MAIPMFMFLCVQGYLSRQGADSNSHSEWNRRRALPGRLPLREAQRADEADARQLHHHESRGQVKVTRLFVPCMGFVV